MAVSAYILIQTEVGKAAMVAQEVGAAFHSELMEPVQRKLDETMQTLTWNDPDPPLVSIASGEVASSGEEVHQALVAQIASPVLWVDTTETLIANGCESFLELGAGRVLSGLVRQINPDVETFSADSPKKLAKFVERSRA